MKSLCAVISSTKGSKVLKEKKEVLEWVSAQIKKVYSVSLTHTQTSEASHDVLYRLKVVLTHTDLNVNS